MKNFLLMAMILSMAFMFPPAETNAQTTLVSPVYGNPSDTVTNTAANYLYVKITGYRETVTITTNLTKISGTLGGTLVPIGSNDGVNFYDISQKSSDTVTVANVAAQGKAYVCAKGFQYYGVRWTGTGTMSGSFTGTLIGRRPGD